MQRRREVTGERDLLRGDRAGTGKGFGKELERGEEVLLRNERAIHEPNRTITRETESTEFSSSLWMESVPVQHRLLVFLQRRGGVAGVMVGVGRNWGGRGAWRWRDEDRRALFSIRSETEKAEHSSRQKLGVNASAQISSRGRGRRKEPPLPVERVLMVSGEFPLVPTLGGGRVAEVPMTGPFELTGDVIQEPQRSLRGTA
jgi:hypothetical protein